MVGSILRSVGAVIAGLAAAMVFIVGTEVVGLAVHPFPPGVDSHDPEVCKAYIVKLPADGYVIAVAGWGLAVLSGTWVATRLGAGRHPAPGLVVGSILLAAALMNMLMLPYPIGFWIANLVVFPAATYLGTKWGRARSSSDRPVVGDAPPGHE